MAASSEPTLFNQAVSRILSSWPALNMAVEHGCGGPNSRQKADNLVNSIEELFKRNSKADAYDVADFLEDKMDDEFDFLLEDGSEQMVRVDSYRHQTHLPVPKRYSNKHEIALHIFQCYTYLKEGQVSDVQKFLEGLPTAGQCSRLQFADGSDSSDEDDDEEMDGACAQTPQPPAQSESSQREDSSAGPSQDPSPENGAGDASMDIEEEDGWTVVKKGGRR